MKALTKPTLRLQNLLLSDTRFAAENRNVIPTQCAKAVPTVTASLVVLLVVLTAHCARAAQPSLGQAIRNGDKPAIRSLVSDRTAIQARDELGNTPLMLAAVHGDVALLELLWQAGADVNATNSAG